MRSDADPMDYLGRRGGCGGKSIASKLAGECDERFRVAEDDTIGILDSIAIPIQIQPRAGTDFDKCQGATIGQFEYERNGGCEDCATVDFVGLDEARCNESDQLVASFGTKTGEDGVKVLTIARRVGDRCIVIPQFVRPPAKQEVMDGREVDVGHGLTVRVAGDIEQFVVLGDKVRELFIKGRAKRCAFTGKPLESGRKRMSDCFRHTVARYKQLVDAEDFSM